MPNLSGIDWEAIIKMLTVYAGYLAREMPAVFDGISPEDLVSETLLSFFASENHLNWDPEKGPLGRFLGRVLRNKFLSGVRGYESHNVRSLDDSPDSANVGYHPRPGRLNEHASSVMLERIRAAASRNPKLLEFIEAALDIDGDKFINEQLGQQLNTTTADVINRKKR